MTETVSRPFTEADAALTRKIGIFDAHNDLALALLKRRFDGDPHGLRNYWLPRLREGGVSVVVCPIYIPDVYLPEAALRVAVQMVDTLLEQIDANADAIELALTAGDVDRIRAAGKIAAILSMEGAEPLGQDLSALRIFHRLGLRLLGFTWMRRTAFADGTWDNPTGYGLSRLGREAVAEMNRLGIVCDVSHASDRTTWDVIETSTAPIVASHSNARALQDHPRNLTDDAIRAIAKKGGVVGAVAVSRFITSELPTIRHWADHVEHLVRVAGIDAVGIGADFAHYLYSIGASQGIAEWVPDSKLPRHPFTDMLSPEQLPGLTAELLKRGFTEPDLTKLYRENFMRVFRAVAG